MRPNPDLVTFTEKILNEKLHFLYSELFGIVQITLFTKCFKYASAK